MANWLLELSDALATLTSSTQLIEKPGTLGYQPDGEPFQTVVPGRGPRVYVTTENNVIEAINVGVPIVPNLPVVVSYMLGREPVVKAAEIARAVEFVGDVPGIGVAPHSHRFGFGNVDYVESLRFDPGLVRPSDTGALWVTVNPCVYQWRGNWRIFGGDELDLTPYRPSTVGTQAWAIIGIDPLTETATALAGDEHPATLPMPPAFVLDSIDAFDGVPLAAVALLAGATARPAYPASYFDLRPFATGASASTGADVLGWIGWYA